MYFLFSICLHLQTQTQLDDMEDDLPVASIIMFRRMARAEQKRAKIAARRAQQEEIFASAKALALSKGASEVEAAEAGARALEAQTQPKQTWFGYLFSSKKSSGAQSDSTNVDSKVGGVFSHSAPEEDDLVLEDLVTHAIQVFCAYLKCLLYSYIRMCECNTVCACIQIRLP